MVVAEIPKWLKKVAYICGGFISIVAVVSWLFTAGIAGVQIYLEWEEVTEAFTQENKTYWDILKSLDLGINYPRLETEFNSLEKRVERLENR